MVARCPETSALGVCVATGVPAVGDRVPHVEVGVGAIATQGYTNVIYGVEGLKLLKRGFSPQKALEALLKEDSAEEMRQVIMIDHEGRVAAFTGREMPSWKGHLVGNDYVVAGNLLVGSGVVERMAEAFASSRGDLAERLMLVLEAGQTAGGDRREAISAALLVAGEKTEPGFMLDLRVDEHGEPIRELRRMFEEHKLKRKLDRKSLRR